MHPLGGLTMALIATSGGPAESCLEPLRKTFNQISSTIGVELKSLLLPFTSIDPTELKANEDERQKARAFGKELAG